MIESKTVDDVTRDMLNTAALNVARQNKLMREDGSIMCWNCKTGDALIPSLHCGPCLQRWRDWNQGGEARTLNTRQVKNG